MNDRARDVETRIRAVAQIDAVIGAMRGIAAARMRDAQRRLDGVRDCAATVGAAIGAALALAGNGNGGGAAPPPRGAPAAVRIVVALGTQQGFVGPFNERVIARAAAGTVGGGTLLVVGERGAAAAEAQGVEVAWRAPMIAHADAAGALAAAVADALFTRLGDARAVRLSVVHALPGTSASPPIVERVLLPFEFGRFAAAPRAAAPLVTLAPRQLLIRLADEYLYMELCEALLLSFAAENDARMRAMAAAHQHVRDRLGELTGRFRRLRQEEITAEINELVAAVPPP